jgi:hypothetical protein
MSGKVALMLADISLTHAILTNSVQQNPSTFYKELTVLQLDRKFPASFKINIFTDNFYFRILPQITLPSCMAPYSSVNRHQSFWVIFCLHLQRRLITLFFPEYWGRYPSTKLHDFTSQRTNILRSSPCSQYTTMRLCFDPHDLDNLTGGHEIILILTYCLSKITKDVSFLHISKWSLV